LSGLIWNRSGNPLDCLDKSGDMSIIMVMMVRSKQFRLVYASRIKQHLLAVAPQYHSLIRQTIEEQLAFQPDVETQNRKPLQNPAIFNATWEIRSGPNNCFRVYYDVDRTLNEVVILAVGVKNETAF